MRPHLPATYFFLIAQVGWPTERTLYLSLQTFWQSEYVFSNFQGGPFSVFQHLLVPTLETAHHEVHHQLHLSSGRYLLRK